MDDWERLAREAGLDPPPSAEEVTSLRAALASLRASWAELEIDEGLLAHELIDALAQSRVARPLTEPAVRDMVLALAIRAGDAEACRRFEAQYFTPALAKVEGVVGAAGIGDVEQRLRARLFGPESPLPRYVGQGDIAGLVRVAALRIALNLADSERRREGRQVRYAEDLRLHERAVDPESELAKAEYRSLTKRGFEHAIGSLDARSRNLLRAHLVEQLTLDDLARTYGVHRSTVSRWVTRAREQVAQRTRVYLRDQLAPTEAQLEEIDDLVHSQLDFSLARVLGDADGS